MTGVQTCALPIFPLSQTLAAIHSTLSIGPPTFCFASPLRSSLGPLRRRSWGRSCGLRSSSFLLPCLFPPASWLDSLVDPAHGVAMTSNLSTTTGPELDSTSSPNHGFNQTSPTSFSCPNEQCLRHLSGCCFLVGVGPSPCLPVSLW